MAVTTRRKTLMQSMVADSRVFLRIWNMESIMVAVLKLKVVLIFLAVPSNTWPTDVVKVYAIEGKEVELFFDLGTDVNQDVLNIKHKQQLNSTFVDVISVKDLKTIPVASLFEDYKSKVTDLQVQNKTITMKLSNVNTSDAGLYRCIHTTDVELVSCGTLLIVVAKPPPPDLKIVSGLDSDQRIPLGSNVTLNCFYRSRTSPADIPRCYKTKFYDERNRGLPVPEGFKFGYTNLTQLVVRNIQKSDNISITCKAADILENFNGTILYSEPSLKVDITPTYGPDEGSIKFDPPETSVTKDEHDLLVYTCDADCRPPCTVSWHLVQRNGSALELITSTNTLKLNVSRLYHGTLKCVASAKTAIASRSHNVSKELQLVVQYVESPKVTVDSLETNQVEMMEESVGTLTCQVNALPAPNITLRTLDNDLMTVEGRNPTVTVSERGYTNHRYTASTTFKAPNCTSRMILTCTVTHNLARVQGNQIILKLLCPPRRATIEGLELLDDYEYYKGDQLNFSFVLIAIPDPDVYNVTSELNGSFKIEQMPSDVEISKETNYEGNSAQIKYTFVCHRVLTSADSGTNFTLHFKSDHFTNQFSFSVWATEITALTTISITIDTVDVTSPTTYVEYKTKPPKKKSKPTYVETTFNTIWIVIIVLVVTVLTALVTPVTYIIYKIKQGAKQSSFFITRLSEVTKSSHELPSKPFHASETSL
ncbi:neural cell adhesion molecule 1-like isoform X2 [Biomphalaria glabrata]|uniref:Neural cell adhesion molecule 1-like isoform X2 n=1 Tax=Biomphalaria glabrata TaxID=6526 RepID=A0A9W3AW06_BIOGL|nr:neural cell adhesion molecule 1-like isoform X2 [Biomphalaria glabrata]